MRIVVLQQCTTQRIQIFYRQDSVQLLLVTREKFHTYDFTRVNTGSEIFGEKVNRISFHLFFHDQGARRFSLAFFHVKKVEVNTWLK